MNTSDILKMDHNNRFSYQIIEIEKIIDGDSIKVRLDMGFDIHKKVSVRIMNIDAPEVHTRDNKHKAAGQVIKKCVEKWFEDRKTNDEDIKVESVDVGKYRGRTVGDFYYIDTTSNETCYLSEWLLRNQLVKMYSGKTKSPWTDIQFDLVENYAQNIISLEVINEIRSNNGLDIIIIG